MSSLLRVDCVRAGYGDVVAVRDVTLQVERAEVVAVLGRNGAGKTTLLRAVSGLTTTTAGSVSVEGADVTSLPAYERVARGVAFVQEGKRVFRARTVEENLVLGGHVLGLPRRRLTERIEQAYTRFPVLGKRRQAAAGSLSGGQQQMLAIATALVPSPKIVMLDEPSAGLAPAIVHDVLEVVRGLCEEGLGVVLVEQAVEFALAAADRVAVMDLGSVVHASNVDAAGLREAIRAAYFTSTVPQPVTPK